VKGYVHKRGYIHVRNYHDSKGADLQVETVSAENAVDTPHMISVGESHKLGSSLVLWPWLMAHLTCGPSTVREHLPVQFNLKRMM